MKNHMLPQADFYLTQSLLSDWTHLINAEDAYTESACQSFLMSLRREPKEATKAMQDGIAFENAITKTVNEEAVEDNPKWDAAVKKFARICSGGQSQTPVSGVFEINGMKIGVYGLCDYVKAGIIYDIEKVMRYEYGKYFESPQHPMYMELLPEAKKFTYLIFDGTHTYQETYRRGDFRPIQSIISDFIVWLKKKNLFEEYKKHWTMNNERIEKVYGAQI